MSTVRDALQSWPNFRRCVRLLVCLLAALSAMRLEVAQAGTMLKSLCRVKGQEQNSLHGLGLVVGLNGTGDGGNYLPTIRSLARVMQQMGNPVGKELTELKDAKNVALVAVTATVPASGARQGDQVECIVSSIGSAKSLAGGRLFLTALTGPNPADHRVYAFAEGPIALDETTNTRTGRIHQGCRLEEDFFNPYMKDHMLTLVIDDNRADFDMARSIAQAINDSPLSDTQVLAKAISAVNVQVRIPEQYREDPVDFIAEIMRQEIYAPHVEARVVINERAGTIIVSGDVEIGPVAVSHKNLVVETAAAAPRSEFVSMDSSQLSPTKLQTLITTLNAVKVPTADIIEIIKRLEHSGHLHGKLVIE